MWKECVILEDGIHISIEGRQMCDLLVTECDDTFIRALEPSDHAKDRCLTGARRTKESDELSGFDIESDPSDGGN